MQYNFDEIIDRRNTGAIKLERCKTLFGTTELLPLWVADMDFRTPDFILDAIRARLDHPVLGYTMPPKNFYDATWHWIKSHHNWELEKQWIGFVPGIVPALSFVVQCFTEPGKEVMVQSPVYYPFFNVIKNNGREVVNNPLRESKGKFEMQLADFEAKITENTQMLLLCNPHNPGGRVWTKDELLQLAAVCEKHNILVISDEIHADMVLPGQIAHTPFASINEWAKQNTVTLMAPTKVFNMPALISSVYIIANDSLRRKFTQFLEVSELNNGNIFAFIGALAAYENGEAWRTQMLSYVDANIDYVVDFLQKYVPEVVAMRPEASFLVWLDARALGLDNEATHQFFSHKAGLGLNKGSIFGEGGEGHVRINVACPRSVLVQAMQQLKAAVDEFMNR